MPHLSASETILALADALKSPQVNKEDITRALELICNSFSFDTGLVYETDLLDHLCLTESCGPVPPFNHEQRSAELLALQNQICSAHRPIIRLEKPAQSTSSQRQLFDIYNAESLVIAPVEDETQVIYGFVVFLNTAHADLLTDADLDLASTAISMLVRYLGVRMYQKKLTQTQSTLERILDNAGVDIYVNDFYTHDILYTNESMAAPYGGKAQFIGKKCWQVLFPAQSGPCDFCPQKKLIDESGMPTKVYSWDYQRSFDGSWFRVFSAAFHWVDGRLAHVVSSADITDNKRNESLIENLANYDQLTQLPNRRRLIKDCEHRIKNATEHENGYLLFFDLDGFKAINDSYGHDAGDEFLVQLGAFLSEIPLLADSIYRNGGDEFVALVGGETITKDHIQHLAHFILARFKKAWKLSYGEVFCNTSIGVACYPEDGITAQELLQKADSAMYKIKKSGGGGLCFYSY